MDQQTETAEEVAARQAVEAKIAAELAASGAAGANVEHKPDDDLLAVLAAEPAPLEAETCGVQYQNPKTQQLLPERCQLVKDHPPSPGHRHGNIGWWR